MNGILIVNKPKEYTSHDIVAKVKKITKLKVGHTGTLDPMATGVLPLLIGEGTKLSKYLVNHDKVYEAVLKLGEQTDTLDCEGKIMRKEEVAIQKLEEKKVKQVLQELVGKQIQIPPMYSAIKVKGKKLYEYARKGQEVEIPKREIQIYSMELLKINKQDKEISFRVYCSKGTYIRTLCETIAQKLQTCGYMKELSRIQVGEFKIEQAVTLQEIEEKKKQIEFLKQHIITIPKFFEKAPMIELTSNKIPLLLNGVKLSTEKEDGIYQIQTKEKWIGIGVVQNHLLKRELIL
ncbi:MAG: tRNA pseudouridine(55) synthase TruB [Clostridia bacterium]|nr:tRNA pseudouridine(55) synthase TruB [Clostridia bacterium]